MGRSTGSVGWSPEQRRMVRAIALGLAVIAVVAGLVGLVDYYLKRSGEFVLRKVEVQGGDFITADVVSQYFRLEEGMPLFGMDLKRRHGEFLRSAPTIKSMTITRKLPDTILVRVVERQPVARVAQRPFGVDMEGCVFVWRLGIESLPSVSGEGVEELVPGSYLSEMGMLALRMLEAIERHGLPLPVVDVDIGHEDYLLCTMSDERKVKLAWKNFKVDSSDSRRNMLKQLRGTAEAMGSQRGRGRFSWDATMQGRAYAR